MLDWRVRLFGLALAIASSLSVSSPTSAQEPSGYQQRIHDALAELDLGHYPEARALFLQAHALQPSARTLRGLGICSFELRQYDDTVLKLEEALASQVKPLEGALRTETQRLLERAYGFLGRFAIGLSPREAQLFVDDAPSGVQDGQRLLLAIGRHKLEARAQGFHPQGTQLDIAGGENKALSFALQAIPVVPPPVVVARAAEPTPTPVVPMQQQAPRSDERKPLYKNVWLWTGVGVAAAVVIVAVSVAATRDHEKLGDPSVTANTPAMGVITVNR